MASDRDRIAQALAQQALTPPPAPPMPVPMAPPPPASLHPDIPLEAQAQAMGNIPVEPLLAQVMHKFGLLNMLRNQANQSYVDIEKAQ